MTSIASCVLRRVLLCTCALLLGLAPAAVARTSVPPPENFRAFAADSIWNLPLRDDAAVSPKSRRWTAWLRSQVKARGGWINSTGCEMPLYWAAPDTPRVAVALDHPSYRDPALIRAWSSVPIPADAKPANCSDRNLSVAQVQPDGRIAEWEFWAATRRPDGSWVAKWGGAMDDLRTDRGVASPRSWLDPKAPTWVAGRSTPGWNVTASSFSQNAGVITQQDLRAGRIDHAVALAATDAASGKWLWPAQRTDGGSTDPNAIPEGARLRLDPNLDLAGLSMPPMVRMIARAAQRYGIVLRDRTSDANVFYTEPPAPGTADPVRRLLAGQAPNTALKAFPWSALRVLDAASCRDYRGCTVTPTAVIDVDGPRVAGSTVTLDTTNSVLEQPRAAVSWDLDGDGRYETPGGRAVKRVWVPQHAGATRVGVRITMLDGRDVLGVTSFKMRAS